MVLREYRRDFMQVLQECDAPAAVGAAGQCEGKETGSHLGTSLVEEKRPRDVLKCVNEADRLLMRKEYFCSRTEFPCGLGEIFTEFVNGVATRQINRPDNGSVYASSSRRDWNSDIGFCYLTG